MNAGGTEGSVSTGQGTSDQRNRQATMGSRVVMLCAAGRQSPAPAATGIDCVTVGSPYQAAAEILAKPTTAVVIDLRLLSVDHLQLVRIARQMDTEVFAVGAVPAGLTSEDLSGVRLIARSDLPDAVAKLAESEAQRFGAAARSSANPQSEGPSAPDAAKAAPAGPSRPRATEALEEIGGLAVSELIDQPPTRSPARPRPDQAVRPERQGPDGPGNARPVTRYPGLLTPEELAALLEDQQ